MKIKGFTAAELETIELNDEPLLPIETKTNVFAQSCDVGKMWPEYDLLDTKKNTVIALALPGYDLQRLHIDLMDGVLSVSCYDDGCSTGHVNSSNGLLSVKKHHIQSGAFARVFDVDPAATIVHIWKEDGILFVELSTT